MRVLLLVLAVTAAFGYNLTSANGRATLVSSQEKGPYLIDVSILPSRAVVSNTHVSVRVLSLESQTPLTEATVILSATGPEGSTDLGPIPALNDFSPQFFETDVPFDMVGSWELKVDVAAEPGEESITVVMDVREGGSINWIFIAVVVVVIVTIGVWTWDRISGRKQRVAES